MPYYSGDLIEEVISQNDIVDTVSEYVTLKKRGRNYVGLCPFHREKTPSFSVSMDKQIFKCFGCSEGGNVISFIMKIENLDFWDAVETLAERANIDTARYEVKAGPGNRMDTAKKDLKDTLFQINRDIGIFYHDNLMEYLKEESNPVKDYVKKRQFDMKTLTKFGIGYSTGKKPLYDYLIDKGYRKEDIFASEVILPGKNGIPYDRFHDRLMFPIFDIRDRIIGFGGRSFSPKVQEKIIPKYLNSQEGEIYHKGKTLYLMNFAKREKLENIIIVEGYMDAIALQKFGFPNAVASLGTALTENQARLIKKYTDNVIIGYDQDEAGQDAIMRGLDILANRGLNVKVLRLDRPDTKDPDEYLNKYGAQRLQNCIDNAISLVEFKVLNLEKKLDLNKDDDKVRFFTGIADILAKVDNSIERELYLDKIIKKYRDYGITQGPIINEVEKRIVKKNQADFVVDTQSIERKRQLVTSVRKRQEQYIVALLLSKKPSIQKQIFENITSEDIENQDVRQLFDFILSLKGEYDINKIDILSKIQDEAMIKEITDIMYIDISGYEESLLKDVLKNKKKDKLFTRRDEIIKRLSEQISRDESEILNFELKQIMIELSKLK